jgi:hypothetical protein
MLLLSSPYCTTLTYINKAHNVPTLHMPNVIAHHQCLHLNPRLRY